jgi:transposase-like protein
MTDDRMQLQSLLGKTADTDFLNEMIGFAANRLMELEVDGLCNADRHERAADRLNWRNGYRERTWETRAGQFLHHPRGHDPRSERWTTRSLPTTARSSVALAARAE